MSNLFPASHPCRHFFLSFGIISLEIVEREELGIGTRPLFYPSCGCVAALCPCGIAMESAGKDDGVVTGDVARSTPLSPPPASTPPPPPPPPSPPPLPVRDAPWWRARGFPGPVGLDNLSLWRAITFSWASPLIELGAKGQFTEETAEAFLASSDDAAVRAAAFQQAYDRAKSAGHSGKLVHRALLSLHWRAMLLQTLWLVAESGTRIGSALSLRSLLVWLSSPERDTSGRSLREGWARASALVFCTLAFLVIHHQLFWTGMHTG